MLSASDVTSGSVDGHVTRPPTRTASASILNVTPGAIRHQIRQLGQELGQHLFVRSKRTLLLTPAGLRLHDTVGRAFSDIAKPDDLVDLVGLHARDHMDWMRLLGAASRRPLGFRQEVVFPDAHLSIQAAREGCGVAVGTFILCADDFRRGSLVRLLECEVPAPCPYFIIQPQGREQRAAELFTSVLIQQVEALVPSRR